MTREENNRGQALLVIVMVMAVALTIGLAALSRSTTDIRLSAQEEEYARALSVAEAGLEEALLSGAHNVTISVGGQSITAQVRELTMGGASFFVFPKEMKAGESYTVWLVGFNASGYPDRTVAGRYTGSRVDLYWGTPPLVRSDENVPALEVSEIYYVSDGQGTYRLKRAVFDPYNGSNPTRADNGFDKSVQYGSPSPFSLGGREFQFKASFILTTGGNNYPYALRLRLIYANDSQNLGVADYEGDGTQTLPRQGSCYESTATYPTSGVTSRVQQCRLLSSPPGIFDYVLFGNSGLTK